jgi:hypothetical protein
VDGGVSNPIYPVYTIYRGQCHATDLRSVTFQLQTVKEAVSTQISIIHNQYIKLISHTQVKALQMAIAILKVKHNFGIQVKPASWGTRDVPFQQHF